MQYENIKTSNILAHDFPKRLKMNKIEIWAKTQNRKSKEWHRNTLAENLCKNDWYI